MTDKQLRKLSRIELLEMLIQHSKEITRLQEELDEAHELLENKYIAIDNAGSIAEASLQLNGVFNAAQQAADQYLHNVSRKQPDEDNVPQLTITPSTSDEAEQEIPDTPSASEESLTSQPVVAIPVAADSDADESITEAQAQTDESIAEAKAQADEIIAEAKAQADEIIAEAKAQADEMIAQAQAKADEMIAKTQADCDKMVKKARDESQAWWSETSRKMDAFYKERVGLREMLAEHLVSSDQE